MNDPVIPLCPNKCSHYCNTGYNDQEYFEFIEAAGLSFLNTTQRGPLLPFKFGLTKYKCVREQQVVSERGPRLSLGAVRKVGSLQSYLVAWRNGLGRVTFLQSSNPNLSYGHFDYMTPPKEHLYAARKSVQVQFNLINVIFLTKYLKNKIGSG